MDNCKLCFKCNQTKDKSDFYKVKSMKDGLMGKCIVCHKLDAKKRIEYLKSQDPLYTINKRKKSREYYRDNPKNTPYRRGCKVKYKMKYPEKIKARIAALKIPKISENKHHWSYNEDHYLDVIHLTLKEHGKIHRFIRYDQNSKMYRRIDSMELLDTKEKHIQYMNFIFKTQED